MTPPILEFDKDIGEIKISGESVSLELSNFWNPLKDQMTEYLRNPRDIHVIVALEFFNSLTAKKLLDLLKYIEKECMKADRYFTVTWIYDKDEEDDEMKKAGESYESIVNKGTIWRFREKEL